MANTADRSYNFQLYPKGEKGGTQFYRKDNSSSVYVHIKSRSGVHRMYVDGAKNENGLGWKDFTATTYRSRKVGQGRMRNYVNERGFSHARLTSWANQSSGFVKGVWSPDSQYNWPEMPD